MVIKGWENFAAEAGMIYDKKRQSVYGHYNGYAMVISYMQNQAQFIVTMNINGGTSEQANYVTEFLRGLPQQNKFVKFANFDANVVTIGIKANKRDSVTHMKEVLDSVISNCRSNSMVSCCKTCGSTNNLSVISVNGSCTIMCDDCFEKSKVELANAQIQVKKSKGNIVTGIVGALLGSLIGVAVWIIIYQLGYIAAIGALVLAVCTIKGYQMLGGKLNVGGVIISMVIAIAMLYFAENAAIAVEICTKYSSEFDNVNFFTAFNFIPKILAFSDEAMSGFIHDLVIGYVFLLAAAIPTYMSIYKTANFRHELTRLELR